jgi:hypothetical protein
VWRLPSVWKNPLEIESRHINKTGHEAFAIKIVGRSAYAAPRANGNVKGRGVGRDAATAMALSFGESLWPCLLGVSGYQNKSGTQPKIHWLAGSLS